MLPRVILHNEVSLDGRIDWSTGDIGLYYELAGRWSADAILAGSTTMLTAAELATDDDEEALVPPQDPADTRPLMVIVDSRGQIHNWNYWRKQPYWRDFVVLCSHTTPTNYLDELKSKHVDSIVAGNEHVDLRAALEELHVRYNVKCVRVDSGGILNGVLLRAGLVNEISVLIDPALVGGTSPRSIFTAPDLASLAGVIRLKLIHLENIKNDIVWLKYEVIQ